MDQTQKQEILKALHEAAKERLRASTDEMIVLEGTLDQIRRIELRVLDQVERGEEISPKDVLVVVCAESVIVKALRDSGDRWQEASAEVNRLLDERIKAAR